MPFGIMNPGKTWFRNSVAAYYFYIVNGTKGLKRKKKEAKFQKQ
jgi:hypothetical protein